MLFHREKNKVLTSELKRTLLLDEFPMPDFSLFDLDKYKMRDKLVLPYELSRGCLNSCFFCYYIHKNKMAKKNLSKAVNELKKLSKIHSI